MTKEELINQNEDFLILVCEGSVHRKHLKELIRKAWDAGYNFRIQEEELNKGASF